MRASIAQLALIAAAVSGLGGCATERSTPVEGRESISIPYDPYNYDPDALLAEAQAHCEAYGLRAVYIDETIDPNSVRWRYRHFDCI